MAEFDVWLEGSFLANTTTCFSCILCPVAWESVCSDYSFLPYLKIYHSHNDYFIEYLLILIVNKDTIELTTSTIGDTRDHWFDLDAFSSEVAENQLH